MKKRDAFRSYEGMAMRGYAKGLRAAWAFLPLLLPSCSTDSVDVDVPAGRPVSLSVYVPTPADTRANSYYLADGGIPVGRSIGVYGYYHDNAAWSTASTPNFMFNQEALCEDPAVDYTYAPLKYWPNETGDKLSFIAYYPYSDDTNRATTGVTPLMTTATEGLPSYQFEVKESTADQVDFLVSKLLSNLPNGTQDVSPSGATDRTQLTMTDRVHFVLEHATSKVVVSIEVDEELRRDLAYYDVTRLELNNVCFTGTLSYTDGDHYAWSGQGGKKAVYNIDRSTAYLLLPQPLGDDVTLTLDYSMTFNTDGTVYTYDSDGQPVATDHYTYSRTGATARPNTMVSRLTGDPVDEWLPNHVYHYHVVLRADRIDFTAEVAPWGDYNWTILN